MDNPDNPDTEDAKTIVNVKGVRVKSWDRGKIAANRSGETMGEWLSRAIEQLANLEEGGNRVIPPGKPANPEPPPAPVVAPTPEQINAMANLIMAMSQAQVDFQKRVKAKANNVLYAAMRLAEGNPLTLAPMRRGQRALEHVIEG